MTCELVSDPKESLLQVTNIKITTILQRETTLMTKQKKNGLNKQCSLKTGTLKSLNFRT